MIGKILTGAVLLGALAAAGSAEAGTKVLATNFILTSTSGAPLAAAPGLSAPVQFNTGLGTLISVEIDWSDITLTATGRTKAALFGFGGGAIADLATGAITVNGTQTGTIATSLGNASALSANKTIIATARSSGNDQTYTSGAIFDAAAAGDTLNIAWNIGALAWLNATRPSDLTNLKQSDIVFLNVTPLSSELDAALTVTYTYTSVPEPATWAMMGLGFAGLGFAGWRSRRTPGAILA